MSQLGLSRVVVCLCNGCDCVLHTKHVPDRSALEVRRKGSSCLERRQASCCTEKSCKKMQESRGGMSARCRSGGKNGIRILYDARSSLLSVRLGRHFYVFSHDGFCCVQLILSGVLAGVETRLDAALGRAPSFVELARDSPGSTTRHHHNLGFALKKDLQISTMNNAAPSVVQGNLVLCLLSTDHWRADDEFVQPTSTGQYGTHCDFRNCIRFLLAASRGSGFAWEQGLHFRANTASRCLTDGVLLVLYSTVHDMRTVCRNNWWTDSAEICFPDSHVVTGTRTEKCRSVTAHGCGMPENGSLVLNRTILELSIAVVTSSSMFRLY